MPHRQNCDADGAAWRVCGTPSWGRRRWPFGSLRAARNSPATYALRSPHLPLIGRPPARAGGRFVFVLVPAQPEPVFLFLSVTSSNSASTTLSFFASCAPPPPASPPPAPGPAPACSSACWALYNSSTSVL